MNPATRSARNVYEVRTWDPSTQTFTVVGRYAKRAYRAMTEAVAALRDAGKDVGVFEVAS